MESLMRSLVNLISIFVNQSLFSFSSISSVFHVTHDFNDLFDTSFYSQTYSIYTHILTLFTCISLENITRRKVYFPLVLVLPTPMLLMIHVTDITYSSVHRRILFILISSFYS